MNSNTVSIELRIKCPTTTPSGLLLLVEVMLLVILFNSLLISLFKVLGENYVSVLSHSLHPTLQTNIEELVDGYIGIPECITLSTSVSIHV